MLATRLADYLKPLLLFDAATCLVFGLGCLALSGPIENHLAVPVLWSKAGGAICLAAAGLMLVVASRVPVPAGGVWLIIGLNVVWGIASVASVLGGWLVPNMLGKSVVIGQGLAVLALADLQFMAQRGRVR
jgi:hypothetical protein